MNSLMRQLLASVMVATLGCTGAALAHGRAHKENLHSESQQRERLDHEGRMHEARAEQERQRIRNEQQRAIQTQAKRQQGGTSPGMSMARRKAGGPGSGGRGR